MISIVINLLDEGSENGIGNGRFAHGREWWREGKRGERAGPEFPCLARFGRRGALVRKTRLALALPVQTQTLQLEYWQGRNSLCRGAQMGFTDEAPVPSGEISLAFHVFI